MPMACSRCLRDRSTVKVLHCKILKAASKLRLDVLLVQEAHVNGLVDWHVQDVKKAAERYGFSVLWLHAKTYIKGGLMILVKDDIHIEIHGPVPLAPPLDERVLRVELRLPSGESTAVMNVHAPNPAADRKVFWEELAGVAHATACLVAGDMNSLTDTQDADYTRVWSQNEKAAMRLEQDLVDDWELHDTWPLTRSSDESREGYARTHVQPGGGGDSQLTHRPTVCATSMGGRHGRGASGATGAIRRSINHGGVHAGVFVDDATCTDTHVDDGRSGTHGSLGTGHPDTDAAIPGTGAGSDTPRPVGSYDMWRSLRDIQPTQQDP